MATVKIPISMDGASFTGAEVEEQRLDGARATELGLVLSLGKATDLNGSSQYWKVEGGAWFSQDNGYFYSVWVKPDSIGVTSYVMEWYNEEASYELIKVLQNGNNTYAWETWENSAKRGDAISNAGAVTTDWTNLLFGRLDDDTIVLYVNGVLQLDTGTSLGGVMALPSGKFMVIGGRFNFSSKFAGLIDDFRMYNIPPTQALATAIYKDGAPSVGDPGEAGLIAGWRWDDESNPTADYSGNGHTLAGIDTPAFVEGIVGEYPTTTDVILADQDSGHDDSTWDMPSADVFENPNSESGVFLYKYASGNAATPTNWNPTWLSKANLRLETNPIGRYMALQAQASGDGSQDATLSDGAIDCILNEKYPDEPNVVFPIRYATPERTGAFHPASGDVTTLNTQHGVSGDSITGDVVIPSGDNLRFGKTAGSNGNVEGLITIPASGDSILLGTVVGANGETQGNYVSAPVGKVQDSFFYGVSGDGSEGTLETGGVFNVPLTLKVTNGGVALGISSDPVGVDLEIS